MGVSPEVSFKTMSSVYLGDLAARASIDFLADQIAGQGFYTTMNEEYIEPSEGKTAQEIVDAFCEEHGLDEVLQASARYLVGWGNVFWWVGNPKKIEFLKVVPLEIIKDNGIKFSNNGTLEKIELDWKRKPSEISGDELIHLAYNVLTAKPLGIGVLQTLCTPLNINGEGEQREPFYQIKAKIHDGMADTIYTFGAPNELWSFPGLSKDRLQEFFSQIKRIPRRGSRFVFNPPAGSEAKVQPIVAERMRGLDFYVETLEDEFVLGLQIAERRVLALQRFLKRGVERFLFDRVVAAAGLGPAQAQVRLNWGMPESLDYEKLSEILGQLTELLKVDPTVIRHDELRKILRDVAKLPLEEEESLAELVSQVIPNKKGERNERISG